MMKKLKVVAMVIYVVLLVMVAIYMFMGLEAFSRYLEMKSVLDIWPQAEDVLIRCICVFFGVTAVVCFIRMLVIDFDRQRLYNNLDYEGIIAAAGDDEYEELVEPDEEAYEEARAESEEKRSVVFKKDRKKEKDCLTRAEKAVKQFRARVLPWPEEKEKPLVSNPDIKKSPKKTAAKKPVVLEVTKVDTVKKPTAVVEPVGDANAAKQQYIQSFAGYADLFE